MITIYTDGASRGNPGPGGWGAIILTDEFAKEIGSSAEHTTNNRMELTAAIRSLEMTPDEEVTVFTDSEYLIKGMTIWIHDWQKKGWRTAGKKKVLNQDLWEQLLIATNGKHVDWKYVAGHSGAALNDRADDIATSLADGTAITLYDGDRNKYPIKI